MHIRGEFKWKCVECEKTNGILKEGLFKKEGSFVFRLKLRENGWWYGVASR